MAENFKAVRYQLIIGLHLIVFIQLKVHAVICPALCVCEIDGTPFGQHRAHCKIDNTIVSMVSPTESDGSNLSITCSGKSYNCADFPKFQVGDKNGWLITVSSCTPKILSCVRKMLSGQKINELNVIAMTGSYTTEDIKGFQKLEDLEIHFRDADTEIPYEMLNSMPLLTKIRIYGGNLTLKTNMFHKSNLENVYMENNNIRMIPDNTFNGSKLNDLELVDLNIERISVDTFRVEDLVNMGGCHDSSEGRAMERFSEVVDTSPHGQYRLHSLAITSKGNLKYIAPKSFSETPNLKLLLINNAALKILPDGLFLGANNIQTILINHNAVKMSIEPLCLQTFRKKDVLNPKISSKNYHQINNKITLINLNNNSIEILPKNLFSDTLFINIIILRTNKIKAIPGGLFSKLKHLSYIDLSDNNIIKLPGNLFSSLSKLEFALLNNNNLSALDLDIFNNTRLGTLSIASNNLEMINASKSLRFSVVHLNVSHNKITVIQAWLVDSIVKIMNNNKNAGTTPDIDLSNNRIAHILKDEKTGIKNCFHINFDILLSNNTFECNCLVATVLNKWYKDKNLLDYEKIVCNDGKILSSIDVQELCNRTYALIGLIGSSCVISLIIFLCVVKTIESRKKIKRNIKNILNFKDNTNNKIKDIDDVKTYDVFISFAHKDNEIVSDILLPKLENDFGQKVCVHYRDWIVGELIPDQIIKSVDEANKTIILLSENFLESSWGYLEFHTAHTLGLQQKRQKLIIILFDESIIDDERLNAEFKSYIVVNNYLNWNNPKFWKQLQQMLPRQGKKQKS